MKEASEHTPRATATENFDLIFYLRIETKL